MKAGKSSSFQELTIRKVKVTSWQKEFRFSFRSTAVQLSSDCRPTDFRLTDNSFLNISEKYKEKKYLSLSIFIRKRFFLSTPIISFSFLCHFLFLPSFPYDSFLFLLFLSYFRLSFFYFEILQSFKFSEAPTS